MIVVAVPDCVSLSGSNNEIMDVLGFRSALKYLRHRYMLGISCDLRFPWLSHSEMGIFSRVALVDRD